MTKSIFLDGLGARGIVSWRRYLNPTTLFNVILAIFAVSVLVCWRFLRDKSKLG